MSLRQPSPHQGPRPAALPPVHHLFEAQAARTPAAVALQFQEARLSYGELEARANQLAHRLRQLGVGPEVRVGLCVERSPELIIGLLGILKAGGAYVPLDPHYPRERLRFMVEDARPAVLVTQEQWLERLPQAGAQRLCLARERRELEACPTTPPAVELWPESLAYVIYTSGSTGRPKGVMLMHQGLSNLAQAMVRHFGVTAADRVLQFASFSFDAATAETFTALLAGATLCLGTAEELRPGEGLVALLRRQAISTVTLPPAVLAVLPDAPLPELRKLITAGEACPLAVLQRWARGRAFFNAYGPTEITVCSSISAPLAAEGPYARPPIGHALEGASLHVLDEQLRPVPEGEPGELYVGGVGVGRGYLGRPELTAERFLPDPFSAEPGARMYRTGDRVRRLPDGNLDFLERVDHQLKLRGFRIEPGEIEAVLGQHPAVRECVVMAREVAPGDKRLVAWVRGAPGDAPVPPRALRAFLQEQLPEHMVPSAFVWLGQFPLTPSGKVDRQALPAPSPSDSESPYVAPRTPTEELLAELWRELLHAERVGVDDDLFLLGAHSLLLAQAQALARERLQVAVPLARLFESPTVAGQARAIEEARQQPAARSLALTRAPRSGPLPLSFPQEQVWLLQQLHPTSRTYNAQALLRLRGELDEALLEACLTELVRRHEVLHTTFSASGGVPSQTIQPPWEVKLPRVDLRALAAPEKHAALQRLQQEELTRSFDVGQLPLVRWALARVEEREWVLIHVEHHFVHDGWSYNVFLFELLTLYRERSAGRPSPLAELPVQYADFAVWQRQWVHTEEAARQREYWRQRLKGSPPLLALATDRPRPATQSLRGAALRVPLDAALHAHAQALARREGSTLYMTMLAAFTALLRHYTGQQDLTVGSGVANRRFRETEGVVGMFVNMVVLRSNLSGDPTFRELMARVRHTTLEAFEHQDLPFQHVVEAVQPERTLGYNPLFQVAFNFHDSPLPVMEPPGLSVEMMEALNNGSAKFDLNIVGIPHVGQRRRESGEGLTLIWEYSTDLFEAASMERMAAHYVELLRQCVEHPGRRLSELSPLREQERHRLLVEWNATREELGDEACIHDVVTAQAARTPDALAVSGAGRQLTYRQLEEEANRLAHHLRALGVGPEITVGVCLERTPSLLVGLLAVLKAGGAYVPLDPGFPPERLRRMLEDAGAPLVLTQRSLAGSLASSPARPVVVDELRLEGLPAVPPRTQVEPRNLAYVLFTSGSTGRPKGIQAEHRNLMQCVRWARRLLRLQAGENTSHMAGQSFDASVLEVWAGLATGACVHLPPEEIRASAMELQEWMLARSVHAAFLPTPLGEALLALPWTRPTPLHTLLVGGARLHAPPGAHVPFSLINIYGPTEITVAATVAHVPPGDPGGRAPPIGKPLVNTRVYVLDERLEPVAQGVPGELYIGGDGVARGYSRQPMMTAERYIPSPFGPTPGERLYRTGDIVRWGNDGQLEFLGRGDGQVKLRGFRIELEEISTVLGQHPQVRQAYTRFQSRAGGDGWLVAYAVPREGSPEPEALKGFLAQHLPEYMVPARIVLLAALPLTASGKVDPAALPLPEAPASGSATASTGPRTPLEQELATVWSELLGCPRPGVEDDFFLLGGNSLLASQLVSRLRSALAVPITLRNVFEHPKLEELAGHLVNLQLAQADAATLDKLLQEVEKPATPERA